MTERRSVSCQEAVVRVVGAGRWIRSGVVAGVLAACATSGTAQCVTVADL
ncbi:MAG: hypothetical protein P8N72_17850 [Flavimaricola sp.]|nr:hypothetical protein [Flavimaricola sp.]